MARIKLGALAQDVRGSLNGSTFSRNRGGAYVRSKVSPIQPVSAFSANSRQSFKDVSQNWAALITAAERAAWIAFAATHPFINVFGDSIIVSGIAMFQGLNKRLAQTGFAFFADPPPSISVTPPGATTVVASVTSTPTMSIVFTPTVAPSAGTITAYAWATKPLPPGRTPQKSDYRLLNDFTGTVRDETYDWGPAYLARFGAAPVVDGNIIYFKYAYLDTNDGAVSVGSDVSWLVAAFPGPIVAMASSYRTATDAIMTTATPHGLWTGGTGQITIAGLTHAASANGVHAAWVVINPYEFSISDGSGILAPAAETGTVQLDFYP